MHALKAQWYRMGKGKGKSLNKPSDSGDSSEEIEYPIPNGQRIVVGHFMVGFFFSFEPDIIGADNQ